MGTPEDTLPQPTVDLVLAEGRRFDEDNAVTERALADLIALFPRNTIKSQILLKVAAINQLYSTQIYAVRAVADHIAGLNIDALLDSGSIPLVDLIARVNVGESKERNNLSFASKYCSWHRQDSYPIYDSRAEKCLWAYRQQFGLSFARKDLWEYGSFVSAVKEFQNSFELQGLTFKQIDKFLYLQGTFLMGATRGPKMGTD
jgi:hypothetical protein